MHSPRQPSPRVLPLGKRPPHVPYSSPPVSPITDSIYSTDDYPLPSTPFQAHSTAWSTRSGYPISLTGLDQSTIGTKDDDLYTISTRDSVDHRTKFLPFPSEFDLISPISSPTPTPMDQGAARGSEDYSKKKPIDPVINDLEESSRISVLGPKMRFVSKAPWEAGEEGVPEETEDDFIAASDALSVISGKLGPWKFKEEKASIKALAFAGLRSATPTASSSSNKDSFSIGRKTQEFEREGSVHSSSFGESLGINPPRSVHDLSPRSSMSGTDCTSTYPIQPSSTKVSTEDREPVLPHNNWNPIPRPFRGQTASNRREQPPFRSPSPPPNHYFHPYANPDVVPTTESPIGSPRTSHDSLSTGHPTSEIPVLRDSPELNSPLGRDSNSMRNFSVPGPTVRKLPSRNPLPVRNEGTNIPSRGFSEPRPVGSPGSNSLNDKGDGLMQNLISLEQAQSQARARAQSAHSSANNTTPQKATPAVPANFSSPPLVDPVSTRRRAVSTVITKKRSGGTIIGGVPVDDEGTPPKTLKHKRSAFMKLFSKDKDKDVPKDVISITDPIVRATSTPPRLTPADMDIPPVPNLPSFKRVVPPPLIISAPSMPLMNGQSLVVSPTISPSPRFPPPRSEGSLDIPPSSYTRRGRSTLDAPSEGRPVASDTLRAPSSAPPMQSEFEGLTLRPVSTFFGSGFSDLLTPLSSPPGTANGPPSLRENSASNLPRLDASRTNSMSTASDYPLTPNVGNNSTHDLTPSDMAIASLQEQISNMRKIHQRQIWELEGQVRDLKRENEELLNSGECETCGQMKRDRRVIHSRTPTVSVVDRPKPKTVAGRARTVFG